MAAVEEEEEDQEDEQPAVVAACEWTLARDRFRRSLSRLLGSSSRGSSVSVSLFGHRFAASLRRILSVL